MRFAGRCIPAADVGGDYFGYFANGESGVDSLIGDVSGHGIGAALMMAEARTMFMSGLIIFVFIIYHLLHFTVQVPSVNLTGQNFSTFEDPQKHHDVFKMMIIGVVIHIFCIGLPIALVTRRFSRS